MERVILEKRTIKSQFEVKGDFVEFCHSMIGTAFELPIEDLVFLFPKLVAKMGLKGLGGTQKKQEGEVRFQWKKDDPTKKEVIFFVYIDSTSLSESVTNQYKALKENSLEQVGKMVRVAERFNEDPKRARSQLKEFMKYSLLIKNEKDVTNILDKRLKEYLGKEALLSDAEGLMLKNCIKEATFLEEEGFYYATVEKIESTSALITIFDREKNAKSVNIPLVINNSQYEPIFGTYKLTGWSFKISFTDPASIGRLTGKGSVIQVNQIEFMKSMDEIKEVNLKLLSSSIDGVQGSLDLE